MDINFSKEDLQFRDELREWLANDYPKHVKDKMNKGEHLTRQDMVDYHKALSAKGWMGYNWPVEYGGTGWSATQLYLFNKECIYIFFFIIADVVKVFPFFYDNLILIAINSFFFNK